jgi:hypothetical protein
VAHPQIAAFARLATENTPATRALEGQKTLISRTMHAFQYDAIHDEIVVSSPLAQAVLTFAGGASGDVAPIRVIQGPLTHILGVNDKVSVDPVNNEIYAPSWPNSILVFDRLTNGNVAPKRILQLPAISATSKYSAYQETAGAAFVDTVDDLLLVDRGGILIYDRTASGDAQPKAIIRGANGFFQIAPKGWLIAGCPGSTGSVCAWSIKDALAQNGNVEPRWRLQVEQMTGGYWAAGIALDPAHKEIIFSSTGRPGGPAVKNAILTFSWPEIF